LHFAPTGRRGVATGGAQRNPWKADSASTRPGRGGGVPFFEEGAREAADASIEGSFFPCPRADYIIATVDRVGRVEREKITSRKHESIDLIEQ